MTKIKKRFEQRPWLLFGIPILNEGFRGSRPLYRCEFCAALLPTTKRAARIHAAEHVLTPGAARRNGVIAPGYRG